ncbi:glycosyltransferase family 2 protein [Echinicola marina]|uniref:glycosyltransferase family 2 protein n=1 Tax=Echinicola marina TaxID=2859768 RepID=UPI001CF67B0C|nr:glycosyltransferase family 2 protein [Echinicola marina]UCS93977.1 glycosyltransferase family 2 protein [Echinicola marina]
MKPSITTIILTYNEAAHIERCIANVWAVSAKVIVVDSHSTDGTVAIAEQSGAQVVQHVWPGNQAAQFNWALDNLPIQTQWVLRLDADEYLLPELRQEIGSLLPGIDASVNGIIFKRRHIFLGKWVKKGTYPVNLLRLFRYGKAVCEQRWMDEHIQLLEGKTITAQHDFVDHNLHSIGWWTSKHNGYAIREAVELLDVEFHLLEQSKVPGQLGEQAVAKRKRKLQYVKQPLFWRSFAYFIYRYLLKGGFTEGKEGFLWHFLQGWWYRTLVDAKIYEIKKACGRDKEKIMDYIYQAYGIDLRPAKVEEKLEQDSGTSKKLIKGKAMKY